MDKQTAIINHRHMWNWLSENPKASKRNYLAAHNIKPYPKDDCFLCEHHTNIEGRCRDTCVLVWPGGDCQRGEALFNKWNWETNPSHRAELARQIRDLPERKEKTKITVAVRTFEVDTATIESTAAGVMMKVKDPPPPPKLTRAEAIAKTREQWRWYANNPSGSKGRYFEVHGLKHPKEACYLCEYTRGDCLDTPGHTKCGKTCPFKWPGGCCVLKDGSGLYDLWVDPLHTLELRQSIAWLISRLPEKEA